MTARTGERLEGYRRKRHFRKTSEPMGTEEAAKQGCLYVMHKHAASHDHFDLRLQEAGVLRSWALPKGASLEPGEKRLAVEVEDHPLEYGSFEGIIPQGEYGGGTVMLWDTGTWSVTGKHTADDRSVISGRTMDEIAAEQPIASAIPEAQVAELPTMIGPQLTTLADKAPSGADWLHGYRIMARLDHGQVQLYTRNGEDWTERFPEIAQFLATLPVTTAFVDGEVTAMNRDGSTSFRKLQESLSAGVTQHLRYYCFDLPYLDGYDLTASPLRERKQALAGLLSAAGVNVATPVRYSEHIEAKDLAESEVHSPPRIALR